MSIPKWFWVYTKNWACLKNLSMLELNFEKADGLGINCADIAKVLGKIELGSEISVSCAAWAVFPLNFLLKCEFKNTLAPLFVRHFWQQNALTTYNTAHFMRIPWELYWEGKTPSQEVTFVTFCYFNRRRTPWRCTLK